MPLRLTMATHPARGEIRAAAAVCDALDIEHIVLRTDISALGSGDLAGKAPTDGATPRASGGHIAISFYSLSAR